MKQNQISAIADTVDTIENNLEFPLHLDDLSKKVGISKYHLQRVFKAIVNKSLASYIRGRRLSRSLLDLLYTDMNIVDIAIKYQFEYEQSYIRAFQQQFKTTPAKYRKNQYELPIEHKLDIQTLTSLEQGFIIHPRMVIKPSFHVQGIKEEVIHNVNLIDFTTNKLAHRFREEYFPLVPNRINEHIYLALIEYKSKREFSNDYIPCVETSLLNIPEPPFVAYSIPAQEYAIFRYVGLHDPTEITFKTIEELYAYAMNWKYCSNYDQNNRFHFERIDLSICSDTYCEMDIYIPVRIMD